MAPPVMEIRGYFYDKEKKKYFKIQHPSSSVNSAYSSHDVKRIKLSDERERAQEKALKRQHGRVKVSPILEQPSLGGLLLRSCGQTTLDVPRIFAAGLIAQGQINRHGLDNNTIFAVDPRPERHGMQSEIWSASQDGLGLFCTQLGGYNNINLNEQLFALPGGNRIDLALYRASENVGIGLATAVSVNSTCRQVAMAWHGDDLGDHSRIRICHLTDLENRPTENSRGRHNLNVMEEPLPTLSGPDLSFGSEGDIHTSVAAPPGSPYRFVFGTSTGILTLDQNDSALQPLYQVGCTRQEANLQDVFALDFLDQNILLSGTRKGHLKIVDLRDPRFHRSSNRIYHPSTITHIRHLDQHRLVVAGLNSSLCQYDMRFIKQDTFTAKFRKPTYKKHGKHASPPMQKCQTRPIVTYPEYHNTATIHIGFDLDLETGIIAAAQEYQFHSSTVQLFSLDGHKLRCKALEKDFGPGTIKVTRREESDMMPIRCVRFARDVEGRMPSLYVGAAQGIKRYAWAEKEEDEL